MLVVGDKSDPAGKENHQSGLCGQQHHPRGSHLQSAARQLSGFAGADARAGYEVRNYGFSGRTLLNKGDRPYMKEQMFLDALAFEPDIVTIKLGTNDTKPFNWVHHHEFMRDLEQMVNAFSRLSSKPQIWLCYPVPAFHYDWGINDTIVRDQVIPYIRKVAQKHDLNIIDLYTPFIGKGHLFADGIHPNEEGALVLAKEVYRALKGEEVPAGYRPQAYPGVRSDWQGYERYNFNFKEKQATLVVPKQAAEGKPWIWRPAFSEPFLRSTWPCWRKAIMWFILSSTMNLPTRLRSRQAMTSTNTWSNFTPCRPGSCSKASAAEACMPLTGL